MLRQRDRLYDVAGCRPTIEERPLDRAPIAIEPCPDQRIGPDEVQPVDIAGVTLKQDRVVLEPRRDNRVSMLFAVAELARQHHWRAAGADEACSAH